MIQYIPNTTHYTEVLSRVQSVKHTLWISTDETSMWREKLARKCVYLHYKNTQN